MFKFTQKYKDKLQNRNKEETGIRYEWYALQRCAASYYNEFEKNKIIWGLTADKWAFAYDNDHHYLPSNGYILTSEKLAVKYILAHLNSSLLQFYFGLIGIITAGGAYTLKQETVREFPIPVGDENAQKPFIKLVDQILSAKKANPNADTTSLEREIDQLVYELYGLTDEEIAIVEEATTSATIDEININTASPAELAMLDGIGNKTAELIIAYRPYQEVKDLLKVRGIGEKTLEGIRDKLRVE